MLLNLLPSADQLHHAYIITASKITEAKESLENFITEKIGIPFHGNPDVFVGEYGSVGVDDLSDVVSMHQRMALGPKKIIVLSASGLTVQAQNSILKMIEEPTAGTHFFMILPTVSTVLPTVLSRVHVVNLDTGEENTVTNPEVKKFIAASVPDRLEIVKGYMTELDKERITKEDVLQFISQVISLSHEKNKSAENLEVLSKVSDYIRDPSSSLKMLFEYLALQLA